MRRLLGVAGLVLAGALVACSDNDVVAPKNAARVDVVGAPAPADLQTVPFGGQSLELWPYTGDYFSDQKLDDPINLLIPNRTPRDIRAALLLLDGDRSPYGLPNAFPFNCVWEDAANGTNQTAYTTASGWVGSAIQLTCGPIGPMRFHLRLFQAGTGTIAGTHFEMEIPGTIDHQVLSWMLPRDFVTLDLYRTGLLNPEAPYFPVPVGTATPTYRGFDIPDLYWYLVVNAPALAAQLHAVVVSQTDVRYGNDGAAIEFNFVDNVAGQRLVANRVFEGAMDQYMPLSSALTQSCGSASNELVHVVGPIAMRLHITATPAGNYISQFFADGKLAITPVDPDTYEPIGETFQAVLKLTDRNVVTDQTTLVSYGDVRMSMPASIFKGSIHIRMMAGPGGSSSYRLELSCD